LIASDMADSVGFGMNRYDRYNSAVWPVKSGDIIGILGGTVRVERNEG